MLFLRLISLAVRQRLGLQNEKYSYEQSSASLTFVFLTSIFHSGIFCFPGWRQTSGMPTKLRFRFGGKIRMDQ